VNFWGKKRDVAAAERGFPSAPAHEPPRELPCELPHEVPCEVSRELPREFAPPNTRADERDLAGGHGRERAPVRGVSRELSGELPRESRVESPSAVSKPLFKGPVSKGEPPSGLPKGIARAALEGASLQEILREALQELRAEGGAERLGIWMTAPHLGLEEAQAEAHAPGGASSHEGEVPLAGAGWRGVAWDRDGRTGPREWEQLSPEAPIPPEVLQGARAVEQQLRPTGSGMLINILIGMRRARWTPIAGRGLVFGVILCATREKFRAFPAAACSRLAAELALVLAWKDERAVARRRYADLALARRLHAELDAQVQPDAVLAWLADSMVARNLSARGTVHSGAHGRLGAAFVSIGVLANAAPEAPAPAPASLAHAAGDPSQNAANPRPSPPSIATPTTTSASPDAGFTIDFRWKSGDPDWLRFAEGPTLIATWQEALRTRHTTGIEPQLLWMPSPVARIVAVPICAEGELCGVLLAGLPRAEASLASLERLEYRAMLAGLAIARQKRERREELAVQRQWAQLAASHELLFVLDDAGRVADLSAAAADLLRETHALRTADDVPLTIEGSATENFAKLFRPADRAAVAAWLRPDARSLGGAGNADVDELEVELPGGHRVCLRHAWPTASGSAVVALERLAAPQHPGEDSATEQTLQGVIEWLEEGVVLFDAKGRVRTSNTRFAQFAGLGFGESAKGATLEELLARMSGLAADPPAFADRWRALARGSEGGVRDELRMAQPMPRILERASRPVLDAAGRKLGRVEIYRDLTAQRVFQSQLLQTEKLSALGQMITGVAHELSNPLTSILGYAQRLLLREDATGRTAEVRQIFLEAERAGGILRQLLFSAREAPAERRRVALNQVVMRSMELQRFSMAAEKTRFELDLDPALPMVMGDPAQLQQVLMNLLGNARQAIQQQGRGGSIRVRTRQTAEQRVQLTVEDDGPGVPQGILARIFDPFFTTKAAGVGTGLGLSIVLNIVREHGGTVNVLRGAEGGAIFCLEFPVAEGQAAVLAAPPEVSAPEVSAPEVSAPEVSAKDRGALHEPGHDRDGAVPVSARSSTPAWAARSAPASPAAHRTTSSGAPGQARVLVVEDEPTVARLIADVLQDENFLVEVLLDGREALDRAAQESFDLVICDMKMPGLDGQHFYRRLAETGNPLRHSFLFVTGDVIAPGTQAFLERHGLPHLAKPFRVEELTARVHQVLDDSARQSAAAKVLSANSASRENAAGK